MEFEEYINAYYGGTLGISKRYGIEKADTVDELHKAITTLKKHGVGVYTGKKTTPAPKIDTPKGEVFDWNKVDKSWDELDEIVGED